MGKSLYKDMLSMLTKASAIEPIGNHLRRLNVLAGMICSCMKTKSSSLEGLSDKKSETAKQSESHVKKTKRWLSGKWTDWETFFAPFATKMLLGFSKKGEFILVIDGSQTAGDCVTLMLSVIWRGYAIPLAWLTKKGEKGHFPEEMHLDLVAVVKKTIPPSCRAVFLGDGEFDGLKLRRACKNFKWEFVLRTSVDRKVDCGGEIALSIYMRPAYDVPDSSFLPEKHHTARFCPEASGRDNSRLTVHFGIPVLPEISKTPYLRAFNASIL